MTPRRRRGRWAAAPVLIVLALGASRFTEAAVEPPAPVTVADYSASEALRLGERMYREGLLPSGEPMEAVVEGDIPVDGTMFTCESCHLRSGLGSNEGNVLTPPTNGDRLYRPLLKRQDPVSERQRIGVNPLYGTGEIRAAYDDATLARSLRAGLDPAGRPFRSTMPRYLLNDRDMAVMVHYLKELSSRWSPGVDADSMTLGVVLGEDIPRPVRETMLAALEAYAHDRSVRADYLGKRGRTTPFLERMDAAARRIRLVRWTLVGPPEGWRSQLEEWERREPVFALLGGAVNGPWEPVHRFCEERKIPCLMPFTDRPVVSPSDWYTLYVSKGAYGEGEAAARYLRSCYREEPCPAPLAVVGDDDRSRELARGFRETLAAMRMPAPVELSSGKVGEPSPEVLRRIADRRGAAPMTFWVPQAGLPSLLAAVAGGAGPVIVSGEGFRDAAAILAAIPPGVRESVFLTWPRRLPGEGEKIREAARSWFGRRGVADPDPAAAAHCYTLGWVLTDIFMMLGTEFYRDYFLDVLDMVRDQDYTVAGFPRLSFGKGQRYAAKGCWLVQVGGDPPALVSRTPWVVH